MNRPITLCDRCKEYARCCLNYDGDNCRRSRTVEPINADRIMAMTVEELAEFESTLGCHPDARRETCLGVDRCAECWLAWLKKEYEK